MGVGEGINKLWMKVKEAEFQKFIIGGLLNTLLGYSLYLVLLLFMSYNVSYVLSFIIGILISYLINSLFVFRVPLSLKKLLSFPIVYLVQLVLGYLLMYVIIELLNTNERVAPLLVTITTIPVTFMLSKRVIKGIDQ
ncbi:GtrA family protein [Cohnella sp. WQ 127256]|uniref:GtrA family protein n=1 Tax=Cohnella sp. WQ 127256 TaxID=2938790 RepID=UPI0021177AF3